MNEPKKNYIDEHGNYMNVQNFTLTQIYDSGVEEGFRIAKQEQNLPALSEEEKKKLCNADYAFRCLYPEVSEENKKALDIALNLINEKLNNG